MIHTVLKFLFTKNGLIAVLALLVALSGGVAYYFFSRTSALSDPQALALKEAQLLTEEVGKLISLPEGETPTVATVTDPERLRDQEFFARAKAGDKVLLYSNARKAYLYDPVAKKLIEVAPLNIGQAEASTSDAGSVEE